MGYGDAILATAEVRRAFAKVRKPVCVGDGIKIEWNEVFENNPKIARQVSPGAVWVRNFKGNRGYIDYERSNAARTVYREDFRAEPGEIYLTEEEKAKYPISGVYIEPNIKGSFGGNKDWGFQRWQQVVDLLPDVRFIQGSGNRLRGVEQVETFRFRDACAALSHCVAFLGTDGGMHHAAAALGIPGVVVWGGLVSPKILGYGIHTNLHYGGKSCGSHSKCSHCREALSKITPEMVVDALRRFI